MTNKNNTLELKILPKVVLRAPRPNDTAIQNRQIAIALLTIKERQIAESILP